MVSDIFLEAMRNLRREGARTYLTLIGVVIGISAIVALISIGLGFGAAVEQQFESLGSNVIFIIPQGYGPSKVNISNLDIRSLENINGIDLIAPIYVASAVMEFNNQKVSISVNATDSADFFEGGEFFQIKEGRSTTKNELGSVLIGEKIANDYFDDDIVIKNQILLNGEKFRVVGIIKNTAQTFGGGPDMGAGVYVSTKDLEKISDVSSPGIIFVRTISQNLTEDVADEINEFFEKKYGEDAVMVMSSESLLEQINMILSMVIIFVAGIGAISLLVGGIGIMNAMISSVLERTKEIGLYKSVGASNNQILFLFLIESAFIGLVGGVIGVSIGFGLAFGVSIISELVGFSLTAVFSWEIVFFSLLFSIVVGMVSGFYPAKRAANLDPVEALRYA